MIPNLLRKALFVALVTISCPVFSQNYYVVIGAFAIKDNASKFTGYARSKYFDAEYKLHQESNLYYVYILETADKSRASKVTFFLQKNSEFKGVWTYSGFLVDDQPLPEKAPVVQNAVAPDTVSAASTPSENTIAANTVSADSVAEVVADSVADVTDSEPLIENDPKKTKGKVFKFVITSQEGKPIPGEIHYVNRQEGLDIATYRSNEYVNILPPKDVRKPMTLVCGIFGYKEIDRMLDYNNPAGLQGVRQDEQGAWLIPYKLERLKTGDVTVMYQVSFYKDAVVMLPASQVELDELVHMMASNANYEIKIHGHCNGTYNRRIIALGKNKNYFNVEGADERHGTAKQLTALRAEAIRSYLIDHGIDKKRMKTFSWGAANMLVSETSPSAKLNDRIEIEIVKD